SIPKFIPIKIIRFRWGQKNGLIRPRPLPPTPLPRHNLPPPPPRTTYHHNHHYNHYNRLNNNRYYQHRRYYNNNIKYTNTQNLPSLLELNPFHLPSPQHTRSFNNAQQFHPNHQQQHYPRSLSRSRFHLLSQLPSKSRSRSRPYQRPTPPPIKPRRIHQQQYNVLIANNNIIVRNTNNNIIVRNTNNNNINVPRHHHLILTITTTLIITMKLNIH
ncbi:unnamed protein product, partial [Rotaria sp. Silwood2]